MQRRLANAEAIFGRSAYHAAVAQAKTAPQAAAVAIRLVDTFKPETVVGGTKEVRQLPRTELKAGDWKAGPGVTGLVVRDGLPLLQDEDVGRIGVVLGHRHPEAPVEGAGVDEDALEHGECLVDAIGLDLQLEDGGDGHRCSFVGTVGRQCGGIFAHGRRAASRPRFVDADARVEHGDQLGLAAAQTSQASIGRSV